MSRNYEHDTFHGVIAQFARDDANWPGYDLEGRMVRALALIETIEAVARLVAWPIRKAYSAFVTWNGNRRDREVLSGMATVFRADLGVADVELPRAANSDEKIHRVA